MGRIRLTIAACVMSLVVGVTAPPAEAAEPAVTGTVRLMGCAPKATQVRIKAHPIEREPVVTELGQRGDSQRGSAPPVTGTIERSRDPHVFHYRFDKVPADHGLAIRVELPDGACPPVAWDSATGGFAVPGTGETVDITGYAVSTQVELSKLRTDVFPRWVGGDLLTPESFTRHIRWRSDLPNVVGGELQVALEPFPVHDPCADVAGLVGSVSVDSPLAGQWAETTVDFGPMVEQIHESGRRAPPAGTPLYVRVVPETVDGNLVCDEAQSGEPGMFNLLLASEGSLIPPEPAPANPSASVHSGLYIHPQRDVHPKYREECWLVTQPHAITWFEAILYSTPVTTSQVVEPGKVLCIYEGSGGDGFFDQFSDLVTGISDGLVALVNDIAKLYNSIKAYVVAAVADALDSLGVVDCGPDSACRELVNTAINYGLAALGLPPSLPDFDLLTSMSVDYLKERLATEVAESTGLSQETAQDLVDRSYAVTKSTIDNAQARRGTSNWPHYAVAYDGFDPAVLVTRLNQATLPEGQPVPVPDELWVQSARLAYNGESAGEPPFATSFLPLPATLPCSGCTPLQVPIVLFPNLAGIPPKHAVDGTRTDRYYSDVWMKRLGWGAWCTSIDGFGVWTDPQSDKRFGQQILNYHTRDPLLPESWSGPTRLNC